MNIAQSSRGINPTEDTTVTRFTVTDDGADEIVIKEQLEQPTITVEVQQDGETIDEIECTTTDMYFQGVRPTTNRPIRDTVREALLVSGYTTIDEQ